MRWALVLLALIMVLVTSCASVGPMVSENDLTAIHVDRDGMKYQGPFNPYAMERDGQYAMVKDKDGNIKNIPIPALSVVIVAIKAKSKDVFPQEVMLIMAPRGIMCYVYFANGVWCGYSANQEFRGYKRDAPFDADAVKRTQEIFDYFFNDGPLPGGGREV